MDAEVEALPLELFRVAVGLVATAYFARLAWEAGDIVAADGLYDHALSRDIFWFSAQPLFHTWMGAAWVRAVYAVGGLASLALAAGARARLSAAVAYVVAVCSYRYSFLVVSVDDAVVHLLLAWMILLPVGRALGPTTLLRPTRARLRDALEVRAPGLALRLFLANVALVYLVAGLTKWRSPLWLQGDALLAVMKLPASFWPERFSAEQSWLLRPLNWAALALEPLFALLVVLPPRHVCKRALGALLVGFHVCIALTLDVGLANVACVALGLVLFRTELVDLARAKLGAPPRRPGRPSRAEPARTPRLVAGASLALVALLYGAMVGSALQPSWRADAAPSDDPKTEGGGPLQRACVTGLWVLGLAQQYRLLDWIDERNYALSLHVRERDARGALREVPGERYLPRTMRGGITLSYLLGGRWAPVPASREVEVRASLQARAAARYCARAREDVEVDVEVTIVRVDPVRYPAAREHRHALSTFRCHSGEVRDLAPTLRPARYPG